jgi:hypothetical protein
MSFEYTKPRTSTATLQGSAPQLVANRPKEDEMRKTAYQVLIASLFVALLTPLAAWAQSEEHLKVDIPFQFRAGEAVLPAGVYKVGQVDFRAPDVIFLEGINNHSEAMVPARPAVSKNVRTQSTLDFNKVRGQEVLTNIWLGGEDQGYQIIENRSMTMALAKNAHPATRTITANGSGM